jgi:hypothetical protein
VNFVAPSFALDDITSAQKNGSFLTINIVRLARGDNISSSAKRERVSVFPENSSG